MTTTIEFDEEEKQVIAELGKLESFSATFYYICKRSGPARFMIDGLGEVEPMQNLDPVGELTIRMELWKGTPRERSSEITMIPMGNHEQDPILLQEMRHRYLHAIEWDHLENSPCGECVVCVADAKRKAAK